MKRSFYILSILAMLIACGGKQNEKFSLTGKTNELKNGTFLYFTNSLTNAIIDSSIVNDNLFEFHTEINEFPVQIIIHTKDFSQYRFMWLENNAMTFDASFSNFMNANVSGSFCDSLSWQLKKETDGLLTIEKLKKEIEFIRKHQDKIVSAYILSVHTSTFGKETTTELFNSFSEENKASEYGKRIANYIRLNKEPKIGERYVDFTMADINGELKKLSEIRGEVVLLEFWASWCGPCRGENPILVKTYEKFIPLGFEIFAVSLDDNKESWLKAIEEDNLNWEHVSDLKGNENEAALIYGVNGIPDNFLIDENGFIVSRGLRGNELTQKLNELLKE